MVSAIDATYPVASIDQVSQGFRDNFLAAKTEIESLQSTTSSLSSGVTTAQTDIITLQSRATALEVGAVITALTDIPDVDAASPTDNQVLAFNSTSGNWEASGTAGGITNIIEDLTPELGGTLSVNDFNFMDANSNTILSFLKVASAVNNVQISNSIASSPALITTAGTDTNPDLLLDPKGLGQVMIRGSTFPGVDSQLFISDDAGIDVETRILSINDAQSSRLIIMRVPTSGEPTGKGSRYDFLNNTDETLSIIYFPVNDDSTLGASKTFLAFDPTNDLIVAFQDIEMGNNEITSAGTNLVLNATVGNIDASSNKILNVTDPTLAQDAATKNYVDTATYLGAFTVAGLPAAASNTNKLSLATDAIGGRTFAISDGADWKVFATEGATLQPGAQPLTLTGKVSTLIFGSITVVPGSVSIVPTAITSTLTFGTTSVPFALTPTGKASTLAFGVTQLNLNVNPTGKASVLVFGTTVLSIP